MGHMEAALRRLRALCRRLARGLDPTAPPKNEAPVDPTTPSSSSAAPQDAGVLSSPLRGGAWQKAGGGEEHYRCTGEGRPAGRLASSAHQTH